MNDGYSNYARDDFQSNHWLQLLMRSATCQHAAYVGMTAACCGDLCVLRSMSMHVCNVNAA